MIAAAMIQKLFSMVGGEARRYSRPSASSARKRFDQARHLHIDPANARIVQPNNFVTMAGQTPRS